MIPSIPGKNMEAGEFVTSACWMDDVKTTKDVTWNSLHFTDNPVLLDGKKALPQF